MNRRRHKLAAIAWFAACAVTLGVDVALYFWAPDLRILIHGTATFCAIGGTWHLGWLARDRETGDRP